MNIQCTPQHLHTRARIPLAPHPRLTQFTCHTLTILTVHHRYGTLHVQLLHRVQCNLARITFRAHLQPVADPQLNESNYGYQYERHCMYTIRAHLMHPLVLYIHKRCRVDK
jgi:hypothetical protein